LCSSQIQPSKEGIPEVSDIIDQEAPLRERPPEERPTVQPQESEIQGVPHNEEMASTEKLIFFVYINFNV